MRSRHVLGTKPRAAPRRLTRTRRRLRLASVALPLVLLAPGVYYIAMPSAPPADEIETVIRGAGFDPLVPPNRLRGPGALYVVEGGGRYAKVCDAEPHVLETKVRKSPTPSQVHDRLESGGFSLSGALLDSINASLGATRVSSIEYTLADPAISEISLSDLSEIEDAMLQQKRCDDTVQRLLKQGFTEGVLLEGGLITRRENGDVVQPALIPGTSRAPDIPAPLREVQDLRPIPLQSPRPYAHSVPGARDPSDRGQWIPGQGRAGADPGSFP